MKYTLAVICSLITFGAHAACPAGSTCTQYNGTVPYSVTGGTVARTPVNRVNDNGINVVEFGADPTGVSDSTAAIQAAIDYAFTHNNVGTSVTAGQGTNNVFCPSGIYKVSYPVFFDPPGNMRGSAGAYNSGTTYALNAVVTFNGIPWVSLAGSNTNHTPTTGTGVAVWWTPTTAAVTSFSYAATMYGTSGLVAGGNHGASCQFNLTYNNAPGLWTASGNGIEVDNVSINAPSVSGGPGHHCGLPGTGIGVAIPGDGGGANRTKLVNVGVQNIYAGIAVSTNTGGTGLGAENKFYDPYIANTCIGIVFYSLQNYINYVIGADVCGTTGLYMNTSDQGIIVEGGNWSCEDSTEPATSFAMTSVNATISGPTATVTATLTLSGDAYMVNTCASVVACASNVYNAFTMKTAHFGVVPFQLASFNASTGAATFTTLMQWNQVNDNQSMGDLTTDLNAVTTVYAAEMVTVFDGAGITATNIHIENFSNGNGIVPTRLINSAYGYGGNRTNTLTDIFFDYDPSGLPYVTSPPSASLLAAFYAQQVFDWITVSNVDLVINSLSAQSINDYLTASFGISARFTWHNSAVDSVPLNMRSLDYQQAVGYSFTSQYLNAGTPGFGFGQFDTPPQSIIGSRANSFRTYGWQQTPAWGNRPAPWATPCVAPAQYAVLQSVPAITNTTPANATISSGGYNSSTGVVTLNLSAALGLNAGQSITVSSATGTGSFASINGTNPASGAGLTIQYKIATGLTMTITGGTVAANVPSYAVSYPLIYGSQQYRQCDWNLTPTTYAGGTTYAQGNLVTSGGTVYYSLVNSNTGNTPASSPTFWLPFHYGFISAHLGWSYGQNLTTGNVPSITWASRGSSPAVYVSDTSNYVPALLFPGMSMTLTGTGGTGCPLTTNTLMIVGVHRYLGYVDVVNAGQDLGPPFYLNWGSGNQCTGTTVGQASYSFVNLN